MPTGPVAPHPRPSIWLSPSAGGRETGSWTPAYHTRAIREQRSSGPASRRAGGLGKTKADVVVPVVGVVPVPVRGAEVLWFVVPGTAPDHTLAVAWPVPLWKTAWEKILLRSPSVSAFLA